MGHFTPRRTFLSDWKFVMQLRNVLFWLTQPAWHGITRWNGRFYRHSGRSAENWYIRSSHRCCSAMSHFECVSTGQTDGRTEGRTPDRCFTLTATRGHGSSKLMHACGLHARSARGQWLRGGEGACSRVDAATLVLVTWHVTVSCWLREGSCVVCSVYTTFAPPPPPPGTLVLLMATDSSRNWRIGATGLPFSLFRLETGWSKSNQLILLAHRFLNKNTSHMCRSMTVA